MGGKNWDIFCNVIDNFGDIGVCWRLARQLATEHGMHVRLWVDDLASFRKLCPEINIERTEQMLQNIIVRRWTNPFVHSDDVADVVIEAFACELPADYLAAMAARTEAPAWINLEYLSAEDWIGGCHGLPSPHPRLPLCKYFFFPGFETRSGGLIREAGLMRQHQVWQADTAASRRYLGLPLAAPDEILVSLFCYENPNLPALLQSWIAGSTPLRCLVPEGQALRQAATCLGQPAMRPGEFIQHGCLTLHALPFSSQQDYDRLLSICDLNFVRGEDSFVRAQWAGRPLAWHIYPQDHDAHLVKLAAFLDRYCTGLNLPAETACRSFWQAWNGSPNSAATEAWPLFHSALPELSAHATKWARQLSAQSDLAANLVRFCENFAIIRD